MIKPRDIFSIFLSRTHISKIGTIEQGHQQEHHEIDIQQFIEEFAKLPQERAYIFAKPFIEGQSSSHHTMAKDGQQKFEIFEFPNHETNGETKMKNINHFAPFHFHGLITEYPDNFLF